MPNPTISSLTLPVKNPSTGEVTNVTYDLPSGGGGSTYTAGDGIDIANDVISVDEMPSSDMGDIISPPPAGGGGGGAIELDDITDVTITNATSGQVLKYDGSGWVNAAESSGGTSDYSDLTNKPSIEGVTLSGNKTAADLGLAKSTDIPSTSDCYKTGDTAFTAIADADYIPVYDTSTTTKKKSTWSNIKSVLKSYFDGIYATSSLSYSTTEKIVGTWINSKPIYQKTVNFGAMPNATTKRVAHGISNMAQLVSIGGVATNGNLSSGSNWGLPLPGLGDLVIVNNELQFGFVLWADGTDIVIRTAYDRSSMSAYVTLRYTKTTD